MTTDAGRYRGRGGDTMVQHSANGTTQDGPGTDADGEAHTGATGGPAAAPLPTTAPLTGLELATFQRLVKSLEWLEDDIRAREESIERQRAELGHARALRDAAQAAGATFVSQLARTHDLDPDKRYVITDTGSLRGVDPSRPMP